MSKSARNLNKAIAVLTSWSMALSPLSLMPASQAALAETAVPTAPNFLTQVTTVIDKALEYSDRAISPHIPRRGIRGLPSKSEVTDLEVKIKELTKAAKQIPAQVAAITDNTKEGLPYILIEQYFIALSKFEGLKILLGQKVDPQTWDAEYRMDFPLSNLSQIKFLQVARNASDAFVRLPGMNDELIASQASSGTTIRSHLDLNRRVMTLTLSPEFLEMFERQVFVDQMTTKSSLMFAGHFAVHRLVDSLVATRLLLRQSPENLPQIPAYWTDKFASLRIKHRESVLLGQRKLLETTKPKLLEALKAAYVNLENTGRALYLDDEFFTELGKIANYEAAERPDTLKMNYDETSTWTEVLNTVITLWNMDNLQDVAKLVFEAKRLNLRWMILGEKVWADRLDQEGREKVAVMIDERAKIFTDLLMSDTALKTAISDLAMSGRARAMRDYRANFQKNLVLQSKRMKDYETSQVSLTALVAANKAEIKELTDQNPSPFIRKALTGLENAKTYEQGLHTFVNMLFAMLSAYRFPKNTPNPLTLTELEKIKKEVIFEASYLDDMIPQKYIDALAANGPEKTTTAAISRYFWGDSSARAKDLSGMLELGRIMKFDLAEELELKKEKITPKSLKLADGWLAPILSSQKRNYFEEIKKDIVSNAPVLGATMENDGREVWEHLADVQDTDQRAMDIVDVEIKKIPLRISNNLESMKVNWDSIVSGDDHTLEKVTAEFRVLVTRASQLSLLLDSYAGFSSLNSEIKRELLLPGFWEGEFKQFSDWANANMMYLLGFFVMQMMSRYVMPVARATTAISSFFEPIFGPNFLYINVAFFGILGVSMGTKAVQWQYTEPARAEVLKRYFECNADNACVSLYADLSRQNEITRAARNEIVSTIGMLALFIGGFYAAGKVMARFARGLPQSTLNQLRGDLQTLGISEEVALNEKVIQDALEQTLKKISPAKNAQTGHPAAAKLAETYAIQAAERIEQAIYHEAAKWISVDLRFESQYKQVGLTPRQAKVQSNLNDRLTYFETQYKNNQITLSQLQSYKGSLTGMHQVMEQAWKAMDSNPMVQSFYKKAWDFSSGERGGQAIINGNLQAINPNISQRFMNEAKRLYGHTDPRMESMLENMIQESLKRPELSRKNIRDLRIELSKMVGQ